jgi:hypothetical protein
MRAEGQPICKETQSSENQNKNIIEDAAMAPFEVSLVNPELMSLQSSEMLIF